MPRGRPKKPRLSRMDAAIDAMFPLGYSEEKVRAHVKQLLKEYGGDEGWPFIEECSYRELIESFLREEERDDQIQVAQCGNQLKDKSHGDESMVAGTSSRASDTQQDEGPQDNELADIAGSSGAVAELTCPESGINTDEADGNRWKDIHIPDQAFAHVEGTANVISKNNEDPKTKLHSPRTSPIPSSPSLDKTPSLPPTNSQISTPSYGWIESDEDQTFGHLEPTANLVTKNDEDPRMKEHPNRIPPTKTPLPPTNSQKRVPSYGWIEGDEDDNRIPASHAPTKTPLPPTNSQKRLPSYGWIESDEDDNGGFNFLKPARGELSKHRSNISRRKIRRRSRWDERPDDP